MVVNVITVKKYLINMNDTFYLALLLNEYVTCPLLTPLQFTGWEAHYM